ncbi:MAG TPA: hypothetical protein VD993_17210 [Chitinophagaceae bacterium]|nr:hypothetical protein [Chitinophagaceae bacterium]
MKRLFTLSLLATILIAQQTTAQLKAGEKMLGGSIGYSNQDVKYTDVFTNNEGHGSSLVISPLLGFGLGGNWIAGLNPAYTYSKQKQKGTSGTSEHRSYGAVIGAFVRKFHPFGERFGIYGQLEGSYGFSEWRNRISAQNETKGKSNAFGVALEPGAYLRAGKRFIIEASVGGLAYNRGESKSEPNSSNGKSTNSSFSFSLTNNLALGFYVAL